MSLGAGLVLNKFIVLITWPLSYIGPEGKAIVHNMKLFSKNYFTILYIYVLETTSAAGAPIY